MSSGSGGDLGAALQDMVTAIVTAIAALVEGVADFIKNNASLFATILGFIVLGVLAIRFGRSAFSSIVNWLRNIL